MRGPYGFSLPPGAWRARGPPAPRFGAAGASLTTVAHVFVEDKARLDAVTGLLRLLWGRRSSHPVAIGVLLAFVEAREAEFVTFVREVR